MRFFAAGKLDGRSPFQRKVAELMLAGQMNRHAPQCLGTLADDEASPEARDYVRSIKLEWEDGS
jgi:hypothetical protein